jgi:hypothetical protein
LLVFFVLLFGGFQFFLGFFYDLLLLGDVTTDFII